MLNSIYSFLANKLKLVSVIACITLCFIFYLLFYNNYNHLLLFLLIYIDVACFTIIAFVLLHRIVILNKRSNKRFSKQIFGLFFTISIVPSSFIFISALIFFDISIDNFFKTPINNAITHSLEISNVYTRDLCNTLSSYVKILAMNIAQNELSYTNIINILKNEQLERRLDFILFEVDNINSTNFEVIYQTPFSSELQKMLITGSVLQMSDDTEATYEIEGYIVSVRCVNSKDTVHNRLFLVAIAQIDDDVLEHRDSIKTANEQYMTLSSDSINIKTNFVMLFCYISIVMILIAIFMGLIYSRKVLSPINKIMWAINSISHGNYETSIILKKQHNEWDDLVKTFNNMVMAINEQREQLAIFNKQMAWKDIARKIAHEIKNPLTPILLSAERLRKKYRAEVVTTPEIFDICIDTIVRQVNNMNNLVKEFSDFARLPEPTIESNDLIKLLSEIVFLESNSCKEVKFKCNFQHEELVFKFDAAQINQVIINVIINAIHAITENITEQKENVILISCSLINNNVFITIEDDGIGFSDMVLKKALEPYYTTRKNGTGLGLAIVYKIMSDHNGRVVLGNSEVLRGAKVTLILPYQV